jgi:hypothetical protein
VIWILAYLAVAGMFLGFKLAHSGLDDNDWKPAILWPLVLLMAVGALAYELGVKQRGSR